MVQQGDFEVQLVGAETKQPFKEHAKDGKVFVEVEPDIEYFISIKKVGTSHPGTSYVKVVVDEKEMKYYQTQNRDTLDASPQLNGLFCVENGMSHHKALKFEKPRVRDGKSAGSNLLMGKVEVKIYDGVFTHYEFRGEGFSHHTDIATADVSQQHASLATKKSLRSGEGSATTKVTNYTGQMPQHVPGAHLETISLTYCAALGLMEVGVIPKPGLWEHHRMKRSATDIPESSKKARGSGKENDAIVFEDDEA